MSTQFQDSRHYPALKDAGFTLIELMLVLVIVGVLSAIALPGLMGQTGKAKEAEAKTSLGALSRAQEAYHYEHQTFYNGSSFESDLGFTPSKAHYSYTSDPSADTNQALHKAYATNPTDSRARDFAAGAYFDASIEGYSQILCVANAVDSNGTSSSVTAQADKTCNGGTKIQ
jgi:prepilin-type N-terminal cleavage/methylation domain-containing protein